MTKSAPETDADELFSRLFPKAAQTAAGKPLHRIFVPPPIPVGGAFYAVTHSQRKYHDTRMRLLARSPAKAVCGAGGVRSIPLHNLLPEGTSRRTRRLAPHIRNVSDGLIHL